MQSLSKYNDVGNLVLRLVIAAIFLYHGYQKLGLWGATPEGMAGGQLVIMKILSIAEPVGAVALILGMLTRWASLGLSIIMIGAIYTKTVTWHMGFATAQGPGWEFDLMILAGTVALAFWGAGRWSVDAKFCKHS